MIDCLKSCATALRHLRLSVSVHGDGEEEKKFVQCVLRLWGTHPHSPAEELQNNEPEQ